MKKEYYKIASWNVIRLRNPHEMIDGVDIRINFYDDNKRLDQDGKIIGYDVLPYLIVEKTDKGYMEIFTKTYLVHPCMLYKSAGVSYERWENVLLLKKPDNEKDVFEKVDEQYTFNYSKKHGKRKIRETALRLAMFEEKAISAMERYYDIYREFQNIKYLGK